MVDFCFCLIKTLLCQHQLDQRPQHRFYFLVNSTENAFIHPCASYCQLALEAELDTTNTTPMSPYWEEEEYIQGILNKRLFRQIFKLSPVLLRLRHWQSRISSQYCNTQKWYRNDICLLRKEK